MASDASEGEVSQSDLRNETVQGVGWAAGSQLVRQVPQIAFSLIITRLLVPQAFGLVGQIAVFLGLGSLIADSGLGSALIQRTTIDDAQTSSVFWAQLALSGVATIAVASSAPLIAAFYREPRLTTLTWFLAPTFLIDAIGSVPRALLARSMRFRAIGLIDLATAVLGGLAAVIVASRGGGVWSLVVQNFVTSAVAATGLWFACGWHPKRTLSKGALSELARFSRNLLGFAFLNYMVRNIDNALIGRFLGAAVLGLYARAYGILLYPTVQITAVVGRVMFASLSRMKEDIDRVRRTYLSSVGVLALLAFPMMAGLALVCDDLVRQGLGPSWAPAIPVIRIFCVVGINESVLSSVGWIYQSQGRTDWLFRWGLGGGAVAIAGICLGVLGGTATSVALGYAGASAVLTYPAFAIPGRLIGMKFGDVCRAVSGVAACTALMATIVSVLRFIVLAHSGPLLRTGLSAAAGAISYAVMVRVFRLRPYLELRRIVTERKGRIAGPGLA